MHIDYANDCLLSLKEWYLNHWLGKWLGSTDKQWPHIFKGGIEVKKKKAQKLATQDDNVSLKTIFFFFNIPEPIGKASFIIFIAVVIVSFAKSHLAFREGSHSSTQTDSLN